MIDRWIVAVQHDYYPYIEEYDSREAAEAAATRSRSELHDDSGDRDGVIWVARVETRTDITTVY